MISSPRKAIAGTPLLASRPAGVVATSVRECLAFSLDVEEYVIDIPSVQEIRSYEEPTCISHRQCAGLHEGRGQPAWRDRADHRHAAEILPRAGHYGASTVMIVLNIARRVVGIVVDGVSDVITLTVDQLLPVPGLTSAVDSGHLLAIGAVEDRMLILIDIKKLMPTAAMGLVEPTLQ